MQKEQSALVKHKENMPKEARKTNDSTFDRIYKYYHNDKTRVELTTEENDIKERWEKAWLLLCRHNTQKQVAGLIERLFDVKKSIAYNDLRNAMMLFGDPQPDMKDAKRAMAETWATKGMKQCWKDGDMEGYHRFLKAFQEINNLNGQDDHGMAEMIKKLKPQKIFIVSDAKELEKQIEALQDELIKDVDHEVVQ